MRRRPRDRVRDVAAHALIALALLSTAAACTADDDPERSSRAGDPPTARAPDGGDPPTPLTGRQLRRGGGTWGVYFAVSEFGDPAVERAAARLEAQGHAPSTLSLECDRGAAEALGVPEERAAVALYFPSEDEARAFAASADPAPDGVARVETRCID